MAETDVHRSQMIELLNCLEEYFRADPRVYVTGNIFLYFRNPEGERQAISPDIFVVRGIEKKRRRIYNLDVEKKAPDVVLGLTSRHTKVEDLGNKRVIYADLGVAEYFFSIQRSLGSGLGRRREPVAPVRFPDRGAPANPCRSRGRPTRG